MTQPVNQDRHHPDDEEFAGLLADRSPWRQLFLIAVLMLATFFALGRLAPVPGPEGGDDPVGRHDLLASLEAAVEDPAERVVLFLGDSTLRGNVLKQHGWSGRHTPVWWARELAQGEVSFHDLSLDGLLPCDMATIVTALDELDPRGKVELVVSLSPRYLSHQYSNKSRVHAREWLKDPLLTGGFRHWWDDLALSRHRLGLDGWRRSLGDWVRHPESSALGGPRPGDDLQLRLARHFLESDTGEDNPQVRALRKLAADAAAAGRRTLFYTTPVNGRAFGLARHPAAISKTQALLRVLVDPGNASSRGDGRLVFRNFDDEDFPEEGFLDHCHLRPQANRRLAERILTSLAIPWGSLSPQGPRDHIIPHTSLPRDGFASRAGISTCRTAAFLSDTWVLLAEPGEGGDLLRLADMESGAISTLISATKNRRILAMTRTAPGEALIILADGTLLRFRRGHGLHTLSQKLPGEHRHREDRLITCLLKSGVLIYGPKSRRNWFLTLPDQDMKDLGPFPRGLQLHDMAPHGRDHLYLLLSVDKGRGKPRPGLVDLPVQDFFEANVSHLRNLKLSPGSPISQTWKALHNTLGLLQLSPTPGRLPFGIIRRIHAIADGDRLFVEAPYHRISSQEPFRTRPAGDASVLWNVAPALEVAYALLWPSASGIALDRRSRLPLPPGDVAAVHPENGLIFSNWLGWRVFDPREVMRFNWTYGVPPDPGARSITASGFTYPTREAGTWRAAFLGSSIIGGSWVNDNVGQLNLMCSVSLARSFGTQAAALVGDLPVKVQGIDFSLGRADLIGMYGALLALDPNEVQAAIFCLDRASLGDPHHSRQEGAFTIVERWPAIVRDDSGLPVIDLHSGFLPVVRMKEPRHQETGRTEIIQSALSEITDYCRRHRIKPIFLDLSGLDRKPGRGIKPPAYGRPEDMETLHSLAQQRGLMWIDGLSLVQDQMPALAHHGFGTDRHFRRYAHQILGQALAARILPLIWRDAHERTSLNYRQKAGEVEQATPHFLGGTPLSEVEAGRFSVLVASTSLALGGETRLAVDVRRAPVAKDPWKQALALFGLRAPGHAATDRDMTLEVLRFNRYDEYGRGVDNARTVLARYRVLKGDLKTALESFRTALQGDSPPPWLKSY